MFRVYIYFHLFFIFIFLLFCLYLPFLQVADRSKVAIGIYPRGCVDRLLWFIISLYLFLLGSIFYAFCAFSSIRITVAFLSFWRWLAMGVQTLLSEHGARPTPRVTWTLSTIDYTELSDSGLTVLLVLSLRLSFYSPKRDLLLLESIYQSTSNTINMYST